MVIGYVHPESDSGWCIECHTPGSENDPLVVAVDDETFVGWIQCNDCGEYFGVDDDSIART